MEERTAGPNYDKTDEHKAFKAQQKFEDKDHKMSDEKIKEYVKEAYPEDKVPSAPSQLNSREDGAMYEDQAGASKGQVKYVNKFNYTPREIQKTEKAAKNDKVKF